MVIFFQIFHALRLFKALCLFFLPNLPGPTLIPCPTSIKDSRVGAFGYAKKSTKQYESTEIESSRAFQKNIQTKKQEKKKKRNTEREWFVLISAWQWPLMWEETSEQEGSRKYTGKTGSYSKPQGPPHFCCRNTRNCSCKWALFSSTVSFLDKNSNLIVATHTYVFRINSFRWKKSIWGSSRSSNSS